MAEIKAVTEPAPDPKIGKPKPKSGVRFPYYALAESIEVAKVMHEKAGGSCDRAQLAALLGYSGIKNGGFLSRVAAAKMFGLIDQEDEKLRVTPRGQTIVTPITEADANRAKYEAFLSVELFKKVFDKFNGQGLPAEVGLKNLFLTEYKVVPDRVVPTLKIMLESAESAGFFKATGNRSRMVAPFLASSGAPATPSVEQHRFKADEPTARNQNDHHGNRGGGNGGGGKDGGGATDVSNIHPAILGLLKELPPSGTALGTKKRAALIAAFTATVGFIYPDVEGDPS